MIIATLTALNCSAGACAVAANSRHYNEYLIPPPPPTPVLQVPPAPIALPYSEAYAPVPYAPPQPPAKTRPNFEGLSLTEAQTRGFGKPRVPYHQNLGPGAAFAMPYTNAPAMNTWFDSSLRWYANHLSASAYYDALATQAPYFKPDAAPPAVHKPHAVKRHTKRVIANR